MKILTLEDVALFHDGGYSGDREFPADTIDRLRTWVRRDRHFKNALRELEALADAAGLPRDAECRLTTSVELRRELDILLAAEEDWQDPAEILDPGGGRGVDLEGLAVLAAALSEREDAPRELSGVRTKLARALAEQRSDKALVEEFVEAVAKRNGWRARRLIRDASRKLEELRAASG